MSEATDPATTDPRPEILMFGADWCRDCRSAQTVLEQAGVRYRYVDLVADPDAARVAEDISGRKNIPVIVYPDTSHQVEPAPSEIIAKLRDLGL